MKFVYPGTVLATAAFLVGCATQPTPNEALGQQAEKSVADSLKDPTSAKFKSVTASAKANCIYGKVLAKNGMGAYTDYHDFVWVNGASFVDNSADLVDIARTQSLESMNNYIENLQKCEQAIGIGSGPDSRASIPDT